MCSKKIAQGFADSLTSPVKRSAEATKDIARGKNPLEAIGDSAMDSVKDNLQPGEATLDYFSEGLGLDTKASKIMSGGDGVNASVNAEANTSADANYIRKNRKNTVVGDAFTGALADDKGGKGKTLLGA
jgi:hypothetical protein